MKTCVVASFVVALSLTASLASAQALGTKNYEQRRDDCSEALVMATYNRFDNSNLDWRLATYVTESAYDQVKKSAGANAVIYGTPVGANYSDYQSAAKSKSETYNESLTLNQATNIMWTGLDPSAGNAYRECLKAKIFSSKGLHLAVISATRSEVSVLVSWIPTGQGKIKPLWTWAGTEKFPKKLQPGDTGLVLKRPTQQQMLQVNFNGNQDTLIIEPYPATPTPATYVQMTTVETYRSPEQVGWSDGFSSPYTLCSADKPDSWVIRRVIDFHLESSQDRKTCGRWTLCGGSQADTSRRACRVTSVQGFTKGAYGGYGRMTSVMTVEWTHPEKVTPAAAASSPTP